MFYIALVIIILIFIWRIAAGFRKGMVHELVSLIAVIVATFCIVLILGAVGLNKMVESERLKEDSDN